MPSDNPRPPSSALHAASPWLFLVLFATASPILSGKERVLEKYTVPAVQDFSTGAPPPRSAWFDVSKAVLFEDYAKDLVHATMGNCHGYEARGAQTVHRCADLFDKNGEPVIKDGKPVREKPNFPGPRDYIVIHIVSWKGDSCANNVPELDKQNWYVLNGDGSNWDQSDFAQNNRIFGSKSLYILYIHFNRPANCAYGMRYTIDVQSKVPVFMDHLIKLGQLFGIQPAGGNKPDELNKAQPKPSDVWGAMSFDIPYVPSDDTITPTLVDFQYGAPLLTMDAKKFDNEGRYHLDFSVGVPVTKITDFSYVSASNTLTAAKLDQRKLFALFDFYPHAVDIKTQSWSWYPSIVGGVGIGSQPAKKALIGVGWGPLLANFYAGLLLNTSQLPEGTGCGSTPTADQLKGKLSNKTCPAFGFGLNIAAGAILDTLKSKSSK